MNRVTTKFVDQRWQLLVLALLLQRFSTVSQSRGARHHELRTATNGRVMGSR